MTFFELIATAERTENKTIITYKANANDVQTANKVLINLAELFHDDSIGGLYAYMQEPDIIDIYKDFEPCLKISTIFNDIQIEQMHKSLQHYNEQMQSYSDFESVISTTINEKGYIKNDVLLLLRLHNFELYKKAMQVKTELMEAQRAQEAEDTRIEEEYQKQIEKQKKAEKENLKAEKLAFLQGFGAGKTSIQIERLYSVLSKTFTYVYDGKTQRKNRRDFIIDFLSEGYKPERIEDVVRYTGSKWNPRKTKPKTEYRLYGIDKRSYYDITKTEYDFACFYTEKII